MRKFLKLSKQHLILFLIDEFGNMFKKVSTNPFSLGIWPYGKSVAEMVTLKIIPDLLLGFLLTSLPDPISMSDKVSMTKIAYIG